MITNSLIKLITCVIIIKINQNILTEYFIESENNKKVIKFTYVNDFSILPFDIRKNILTQYIENLFKIIVIMFETI